MKKLVIAAGAIALLAVVTVRTEAQVGPSPPPAATPIPYASPMPAASPLYSPAPSASPSTSPLP